MTKPDVIRRAEEWFWSQVQKEPGDGCWRWLMGGQVRRRPWVGKVPRRVAWELTTGEIPAGKVLIKACEGADCVRPDHHQLAPRAHTFKL